MYRTRPVEDSARRWRRFCRLGWRAAAGILAAWMGAMALLFRLAPLPPPLLRAAPPQISWRPASGRGGIGGAVHADVRALWSPSVFALPSPVGFSRFLRREKSRIQPPAHLPPAGPAYLEGPNAGPTRGRLEEDVDIRFSLAGESEGMERVSGVFPPRTPEAEAPRMGFPPGWESRLFSGIDLDYGKWAAEPWGARVDMRFDGDGVAESVLLSQPSGIADVDRRLARSARRWRLLDPGAPRTGSVGWRSPGRPAAPASTEPASAGEGDGP